MGRYAPSRRVTCESCLSIDVRIWHRQGLLRPAGQRFSSSWTRNGKPTGSIGVRTEADAVVLTSRGVASGNASSSACRSCGQDATSVAHVAGSAAARLPATDPAEGAWRSCTCAHPRYSRADNAAA
jgi:hypothetical protein